MHKTSRSILQVLLMESSDSARLFCLVILLMKHTQLHTPPQMGQIFWMCPGRWKEPLMPAAQHVWQYSNILQPQDRHLQSGLNSDHTKNRKIKRQIFHGRRVIETPNNDPFMHDFLLRIVDALKFFFRLVSDP